jgi:outer membrane protein assembly factor BamB
LVSDKSGGLSKLSPGGDLLWHLEREAAKAATTGPVVSPGGAIYYVAQREIVAVSPQGELLWSRQPPGDAPPTEMVQVGPDGEFLIWGDVLLDAGDGSVIEFEALSGADAFLVGADGETYLVQGHEVIRWTVTQTGARRDRSVTWDHQNFTIARRPQDAGVTPDRITWLFYTGFARSFGFGEDTRVVWLDEDGSLLGNVHYGTRNSKVIGVDQKGTVYACGNLDFGYGDPECQAFSPESEEPSWKLALEQGAEVSGGALVPGRLYVATREGFLYAIGKGERMSPPQAAGPAEPPPSTEAAGALLDLAQEPIGPADPVSRLFFEDGSGFSGALAVSLDGILYLASAEGTLYSLAPSGDIRWQAELPAGAVGGPALNHTGRVFVADQEGGLSAYSGDGERQWRVEAQPGLKGIAGTVVAPGGNIYYTVGTSSKGSIRAVSPEGELLWLAEVKSELFYVSPEASPAGDLIFFRNEVFDAQDGSRLEFDLEFEVDRFFSGNDGRTYLLAGGTVVEWRRTGQGIEVAEERVLSSEGKPLDAGVTEQGLVWLLYARGVFWYARDGEALGGVLLDNTYLTHVVGVDQDFTVYACGRRPQRLFEGKPTCFALSPGSVEPAWVARLGDQPEEFNGGALVTGKVYAATEEGHLYLIGEN